MDRVVLGGCVLLVALGVLMGLGISAEQSIGGRIRDALELLSFVGTAVTGVVAIVALTSWHMQFKHAEKWKSIKKLQESLDGGKAATDYLNSMFRMLSTRHRNGWSVRKVDFMSDVKDEQEQWFSQCFKVDRAWQELCLVMDEKDFTIVSITHREIDDLVSKAATEIISVYLGDDQPDLAALYVSTERCSRLARDKTNLMFSQTGLLQRSLVGG